MSTKPGCRSHLQLRESAGGAWIILALFAQWDLQGTVWSGRPTWNTASQASDFSICQLFAFRSALALHLDSYRTLPLSCIALPTSHYSCASIVRCLAPPSPFRHRRSPATLCPQLSLFSLSCRILAGGHSSSGLQIALRTACSRLVTPELTTDLMLDSAILMFIQLGPSAPGP